MEGKGTACRQAVVHTVFGRHCFLRRVAATLGPDSAHVRLKRSDVLRVDLVQVWYVIYLIQPRCTNFHDTSDARTKQFYDARGYTPISNSGASSC